jgi:hypothetical protein
MNDTDNKHNKEKGPSDFIVGLVTFLVFVLFMTVWMYFGTAG